MSTLRMTSDLRRQLILSAARRCFARNGFAGTTTKSVAAAAAISEGLLFKHFPTKSALYAEILAEECEAVAKVTGDSSIVAALRDALVGKADLLAQMPKLAERYHVPKKVISRACARALERTEHSWPGRLERFITAALMALSSRKDQ